MHNLVDVEMSSLLRLWLSVAIYQLLIEVEYGNLPNGCRASLSSKTIFFCYGIDINKVAPFLPSNATKLEISLSKQNNLTLPFQSYFPSLISLKLVNGELERIEANSLSGLAHLEQLSLADNKLSHLQQDSLLGLSNLQTLNLQNNRFVFLNDVIPALFPVGNLTSLDLSNNLFESISFEEPEKLTDLTIDKLKLSGCRVNSTDPLVLTKWNIRELHISNNPIDEKCLKNISLGLQNSSVHRLEALKLSSLAFRFNENPLLPLYNSKIQQLSIGDNEFNFKLTFSSFVSLRKLQIVNSEIFEFDMGTLLTLPHIEHLKLSGNRIRNLDVNKLTSSPNGSNLKILDLRNNYSPILGTPLIPKGTFSSLSNLLELTLEETLFGHIITTKTFMGLQYLLKLRLAECFIEQIEDAAFQDLRSLKVLYLGGNKLHTLRSEMFIGLHNLSYLYLNNNFLSFSSESSPFCHLTNLEMLYLMENNITNLEPSYFANLTKLEAINLNYNPIVPWNISIMPEGGCITFMLLRSTKLNIVTPVMLKDFDGLHLVNLADNKFDCWDCNMRKFQRWITSTNVTLEDLEKYPKTYACYTPEYLKGAPIATVKLDTEHCSLKQENTILLVIAFSCTFTVMVIVGVASFKFRWHFRYYSYLLRSHVKRFREVQDSFSYEYDAFVSYDPADCNWITHHLLATLETDSSHIKFCLLDRDCVAGNDIMEEIFEVIQKCRKTLLVLSESYVQNQWCMFEMQMAQHSLFEEKRDSLILIQLQPIEEEVISANLAYLITTRTYIMWTDHPMGQKLFWKRLLAALAKPDKPTLRMSWIV